MRPEKIQGKKILYGCLDWGSGHVSRSVPLIAQLAGQGNTLVIWCSKKQEIIFRQFDLKVEYKTGFDQDFRFTGDGNFFREMLRNSISFFRNIRRERKAVQKFVSEENIDLVISDHRYGLHAKGIPTIFLTHQVLLPANTGPIAQKIHRSWMKRFGMIWIMDSEESRLAGKLSSPVEKSIYIGHFSRFSMEGPSAAGPVKYVAVISGPDEYAQQFYREIMEIALKNPGDWAIVCSRFMRDKPSKVRHFRDWEFGDRVIRSAETIISRVGYSTLMDLQVLRINAILMPTPGQLEQEYLSEYHKDHPYWKVVKNNTELKQLLLDKAT